MLSAVWLAVLLGLAAWSGLAWGLLALLSASSEHLGAWIAPYIGSADGRALLHTGLHWKETIGETLVRVLWIAGSLGLMLTAAFATLLLRRGRAAA